MLLVCTWNPKAATVRFELNLKALEVHPAAAVDAESPGGLVQWNAQTGVLNQSLDGYGVRMVRLK